MVASRNARPHDPSGNPVDKRPAANRVNATRSTGPRTPEGKARSSMNAVKHGLTAQTAVLPGEDPEELRRFAEDLTARLRPMGPLQAILVQRVVSLAWKLRRVAAAEESAALEMDETRLRGWSERRKFAEGLPFQSHAFQAGPRPQPRDAGELLAASFSNGSGGRADEGKLVRLTGYELKLEGALRATLRELRALQRDDSAAAPEQGPAEQTQQQSPRAAAAAAAPAPVLAPPPAPATESASHARDEACERSEEGPAAAGSDGVPGGGTGDGCRGVDKKPAGQNELVSESPRADHRDDGRPGG